MGETVPYFDNQIKASTITISAEPFPSPAGYCHLTGIITISSGGHSIVLSDQLLKKSGKHGKISAFHDYRPTVTCLSSCIRNNAVWNTMMVDKALC